MTPIKDGVELSAHQRQGSVGSHAASNHSTSSSHDDIEEVRPRGLERFPTGHSMSHDAPIAAPDSVIEIPDEVYDRLPPHRKLVIVFLLSFCSFLAPISSTSVMAASPEVAATYNTTGSIINISNALYLLFMGLSPMIWGPMGEVYGRRWVTLTTGTIFLGCSIGTALAPNLGAFFIFRILTAIEGTSFIIVGAAVISDIYRPIERGTAMGWFLSGTLIGPAIGPFIGGVIVTYQSWRVIFWLQTGLAGVAALGSYFLLPETIYHKKIDDLVGYSGMEKGKVLWHMINPWRVVRLYEYPNLLLAGLASSCLLWNMYSILSSIRYVLNPRFHLTSPMDGGFFYLAPGAGYLFGSFFGGRYADYIVKKYIKKRGWRIPEDRMISALPFMGIAIPGCILVYGWCVDKDKGGIPVAVIMLFLQGVAQLFCFPSLNAYCLDVMPGRSGEAVAGNYAFRYLLGCAGTAVVIPATDRIGVGAFSTISVIFLLIGALSILATILWGRKWRDRIDAKKKAKRLARRRRSDDENENVNANIGDEATNPVAASGTQTKREEV